MQNSHNARLDITIKVLTIDPCCSSVNRQWCVAEILHEVNRFIELQDCTPSSTDIAYVTISLTANASSSAAQLGHNVIKPLTGVHESGII